MTKMKVQCDVCDRNKAAIMCCADDAALCVECDNRAHTADKLVYKHERVPFITSGDGPRCDICQEKTGYFFCLEDRALLCRNCDLSIHTVNTLSANHQRFLLPGIRIALEAIPVPDTPEPAAEGVPQSKPLQQNTRYSQHEDPQLLSASPRSSTGVKGAFSGMEMKPTASVRHPQQPQFSPQYNNVVMPARIQGGGQGYMQPIRMQGMMGMTPMSMGQQNTNSQQNIQTLRRSSITEFLTEGVPGWRMDDLLNISDTADGFNASDLSCSRVDMRNLGDFDWAADFSLFDDQIFGDEQHEVPQMHFPPTATGLSRGSRVSGVVMGNLKQESALVSDFGDAFVVPDLGLQH